MRTTSPLLYTKRAGNLHSDENMEDKIKLSDPRVQKLIRTYLEVFRELPPPASCDKLVQMDLKLKPDLVGHKIRRRPWRLLKSRPMRLSDRYKNALTLADPMVFSTWHMCGFFFWRHTLDCLAPYCFSFGTGGVQRCFHWKPNVVKPCTPPG